MELLALAPIGVSRAGSALAMAGCIPMVPGGAATQCIIGLLELTGRNIADPEAALLTNVSAGLRVILTIGAIGAGLAIVRSLVCRSDFPVHTA